MGRFRRKFRKGEVYFVTCRASSGLPFVPNAFIEKLLLGLLARAQHLYPGVTICHFTFMTNHYHFIVTLDGDASQMKSFFGYLNGEIASAFNRLQGVTHRKFWMKRYNAKPILTPNDVVEKIAYTYLNPVAAGLVDKAKEWTGASSGPALRGNTDTCYKWVSSSLLSKLPHGPFSKTLVEKCLQGIHQSNRAKFPLKIRKNSWRHCFQESKDWSDQQINERVESRITQAEVKYRQKRISENRRIKGARKLQCMSIYTRFKSKTYKRDTLCISSCPTRSANYQLAYRNFREQCRLAWEALCLGISVDFPIDGFIPSQNPISYSFVP